MAVTNADYHLTYGLHSGIPLCCAIEFADGGGKGGPCPKCLQEDADWIAKELHICDENTPACQPYLDRVELNIIAGYKRWREGLERVTNHTKDAALNDCRDTWGTSFDRPLGDELRGLLKEDNFRLVHICWPAPGVYWYIYQRREAKKAKCGICNTKFSLVFPTVGKQSK